MTVNYNQSEPSTGKEKDNLQMLLMLSLGSDVRKDYHLVCSAVD